MFNQWRRFQFFDKELVKGEDGRSPHPDLSKLKVTAAASGKGQTIFGDEDGCITMCDRKFQLCKFQAFEKSVSHLYQLQQQSILISVGDDHLSGPVLKVWNLDKADKETDGFLNVMSKDVFEGLTLSRCPATCVTASESLSLIAVGLQSGSVILVEGDVQHNKASSRVLTCTPQHPIIAMGLDAVAHDPCFLVASSSRVLAFRNLRQDSVEVLDEQGCGDGCATYTDEHELIVGRQEALYCFNRDGRAATYAFEGRKVLLAHMRSYLLVATADRALMNTVTVYDMKNKLVAFSAAAQEVRQAVWEWGSIILVCGDGAVVQVTEKDTQAKMEMLFRRNLYSVAINLAQSQQLDESFIVDIQRKYGDHLYSKSDFDGAMGQYLATVGKLEPSYVIRKFLDAQRIHNLTSYLHALHERRLANAEHTTLLLNCYTKLKDHAHLEAFIRADGLALDAASAIKTLRGGGYSEHAVFLAEQHRRHEECLSILLQDLRAPDKALSYLQTLPTSEALAAVRRHGALLLSLLPAQTTHVLKALLKASEAEEKAGDGGDGLQGLESILHIFVRHKACLITLLESVLEQARGRGEALPALLSTTLLELYLSHATDSEGEGAGDEGEGAEASLADKPAHKTDAVDDSSQPAATPPPVSPTALPPLSPSPHTEAAPEVVALSAAECQRRAVALLESGGAEGEEERALTLCQESGLEEGVAVLLERRGLYKELIQRHMQGGDPESVLAACNKWSDHDPMVWVSALHWLASLPALHHDAVQEVLKHIEQRELLPAIIVVQVLGQHPKATLSLVKGFMARAIQKDVTQIQNDSRVIQELQEETERMRAEIEENRRTAKVFQSRRCGVCGQALEVPSVHLMCAFEGTPCSFHARCLPDQDSHCPLCGPPPTANLNPAALPGLGGDGASPSLQDPHEQFFKHLRSQPAEGGRRFEALAQHFAKGLFPTA